MQFLRDLKFGVCVPEWLLIQINPRNKQLNSMSPV